MFEGFHRPVLSRRQFAVRMASLVLVAAIADGIAMAAGAIGYHSLEGLDWLDAGVDAALIMTGNGPIHHPQTPGGKLFTIVDALLGVILFAAVIGVLLIPVFHRMLHVFHSLQKNTDEKNQHSTLRTDENPPAATGGRT